MSKKPIEANEQNGELEYKEDYTISVCPFVKGPPSKDCYVCKTSFINMLAVQEYCGKNFEECVFYHEHVLKGLR